MFIARFSYDIAPSDRDSAVDLIGEEIAAAQAQGLSARLLVPVTRGPGGPALQFEVELASLDQLDTLRHRGFGSEKATAEWADRIASVLKAPPQVEILKIAPQQ
jgi:hypothetical protein